MSDIDKIVKELAAVYHFDGDLTAKSYEEQLADPNFIKMLTFNCLVMDAIHHCYNPFTKCRGCRSAEVFEKCQDAECRRLIETSRFVMLTERVKEEMK